MDYFVTAMVRSRVLSILIVGPKSLTVETIALFQMNCELAFRDYYKIEDKKSKVKILAWSRVE